MKNRIYSIALGLFLITACAKAQQVKITGELPSNADFVLFGQNGGEIKKLQIDDDFQFNYEGALPEGYYFLDKVYLVYLQPGFDLVISEGETDYSLAFEGKGAVFNKFIQESSSKLEELYTDGSLFGQDIKSFKSSLQKFTDWVDQELKKPALAKSQRFVSTEKKRSEMAVKSMLLSYIDDYTKDNNQSLEKLMDYVETLEEEDWEKPEVIEKRNELQAQVALNKIDSVMAERLFKEVYAGFDMNDGDMFQASSPSSAFTMLLNIRIEDVTYDELEEFYRQAGRGEYPPRQIVYAKYVKSNITDKNIKEFLLKSYALAILEGTEEKYIEPFIKDFKNTVTNPRYINEVDEVYNKLKLIAPGKPSPKFVGYENHAGGKNSLDDFKGKYVYIDFWATWCKPCKAEIPYLKVLEEKYHGKNIAFVSISLDRKTEYEAWKKMVVDLEASGIQLFADKEFESDFATAYHVSAIPRFILLDPNGNIISNNASRPSEPQLAELLNSLDL